MLYAQRFYRNFQESHRWVSYRVQVESTDLYLRSQENKAFEVQARVREIRHKLKEHIRKRPEFAESLKPLQARQAKDPVLRRMYRAGQKAETGPMASVAGAIAEDIGHWLARSSPEVLVENGGDVFFKLVEPAVYTVYAGKSSFSGKLGVEVLAENTPLAVCTSSGTVGHSYSKGQADAATIVSRDAALADAVATGAANMIASEKDFQSALEYAMGISGVRGVLLIFEDKMAVMGEVKLCPI